MKGDLCLPSKAQIAHEILAYLAEHPDSQDTLDGIVHWWLLERKIKYQKVQVEEALSMLQEQGLIIERKLQDSSSSYLIDQGKQQDINAFLRERNHKP